MDERIEWMFSCLPSPLRRTLARMREGQTDWLARLSEIRLRAGHYAALVLDGENLALPILISQGALDDTLAALCGGSLYAYGESLRQGYVTAFGCRVGVAGRAVLDGGQVSAMAAVSSLCIRLPHNHPGAGAIAESVFRLLGCRAGILVYSPPGGGKTTLLRELSRSLSAGAAGRRVVLIDTRGELYDADFSPACQVDVLRGYPIAIGIEMATRTLSPQVIVCDEIGNMQEAEAVLRVKGCGVPLIVSAHAADINELLHRPPIAALASGGVFGAYIGIRRVQNLFFHTVQSAGQKEMGAWRAV